MSLRQKYLKIVSELAASGAIGAAVLLGAAPPALANAEPSATQPGSADNERVSERLAAIRDAVSVVAGSPAQQPEDIGALRLAWGNWWRNGGWGGGWGRPWGGYGYGYGAPWGNWRNGWNNWRNFWHNW